FVPFLFNLLTESGRGDDDPSEEAQEEWCCERGLNSRPLPYQGSALPLSYRSRPASGRGPGARVRGGRRAEACLVGRERFCHNESGRARPKPRPQAFVGE